MFFICCNFRTNRDDAEEEDAELDHADDGAEAGLDGVVVGRPRRRRKQRRNYRQQTPNRRRTYVLILHELLFRAFKSKIKI